jgi:thiol-disulfide isomerase/thioredoxin
MMKRTALWGWLLVLGAIVGCQGENATEEPADVEPPTVTVPDESADGAIEAADDADAATDDLSSLDAADAGLADASEEADAVNDEAGAAAAEETELTQMISELTAAMNAGDVGKAIDLLNAGIDKFPNREELKINRMLLQAQYADSLVEGDKAQAAEELVKSGEYAAAVQDAVEKLPEDQRTMFQQFLGNSMWQQARGYAYQGKADEATAALEQAAALGLTSFGDVEEDEMLAPLRDNEAFGGKLAELKEQAEEIELRMVAQEFAEQESFDFSFSLPNLDQETVSLSDFDGKLVIVDFWGTWCPPCRKEIPYFVKLQEKYADDLAIVGITYENGEGEEVVANVRSFAEEQGINYPLVMGDTETREQVPEFRGYPTTLFLDRAGKVRLMIVGLHPYEKLEMYLKHLMAEENADEGASS